jgi:hypothetical protein
MRHLYGLGAACLVAASAMIGCGDDEAITQVGTGEPDASTGGQMSTGTGGRGTGGNVTTGGAGAGTGGTATGGSGGSGGASGSGGSTGGAGGAATGGAGGNAPDGGDGGPTCLDFTAFVLDLVNNQTRNDNAPVTIADKTFCAITEDPAAFNSLF